jgi:hypothetical protein
MSKCAQRVCHDTLPWLGLISIIVTRGFCVLFLNRVHVHLIVHETNNGQSSAEPLRSRPRVHQRVSYSLKLLDGRSRANIARALSEGESCRSIARRLHHSIHTVLAVRDADWQQITARKERIAAQCERNATLAAEQLAERLETEKLSANQLVPVLGVSVDKMLALRGDSIQTLHHIHSFDLTDDDLIAWMIGKQPKPIEATVVDSQNSQLTRKPAADVPLSPNPE